MDLWWLLIIINKCLFNCNNITKDVHCNFSVILSNKSLCLRLANYIHYIYSIACSSATMRRKRPESSKKKGILYISVSNPTQLEPHSNVRYTCKRKFKGYDDDSIK